MENKEEEIIISGDEKGSYTFFAFPGGTKALKRLFLACNFQIMERFQIYGYLSRFFSVDRTV